MAKPVTISRPSVQRIWAGEGLQPHRVCTFKVSNDPTFADKLKDVVDLYVDPPAHAVVPVLTRKATSRPLIAQSPAADDEAALRHPDPRCTITQFAALNVLEGEAIGRCMQRHRHQEFIRFLNAVEREVPANKKST